MAAGIINTFVDAFKFLDGDKVRVCVRAMLSPGAASVAQDIALEVCLLGSFRALRYSFSLFDMIYHDPATGTYKTSFVAENVPAQDVGVMIIAKVLGVEDSTTGIVVCKDKEMIGDKTFDLRGNVLLVNPQFHEAPRTVSVINQNVLFNETNKKVVGNFDLSSPLFGVEHVFVRLFRRDVDDVERLVDDVSFSKDTTPQHVQFVDDEFSKKTYGHWSYKGTISVKDKERTFLLDFIDRMSWEILTLKEVSDELEKSGALDCVSLVWTVSKTPLGDKYLAARAATLALLHSFSSEFGKNQDIETASRLLGEKFLSFESLSLFLDFCFVLLESAESRAESLPVIDLFPFELSSELDATAVVRT